MVTKAAKEYTDSHGPAQGQGQHGHRIGRDAMELAPRVDHIVLFSGDGDFRPLVESLQRQGVRVSVVSTIRSQPPMIADELRRQADNFHRAGRAQRCHWPPAARIHTGSRRSAGTSGLIREPFLRKMRRWTCLPAHFFLHQGTINQAIKVLIHPDNLLPILALICGMSMLLDDAIVGAGLCPLSSTVA